MVQKYALIFTFDLFKVPDLPRQLDSEDLAREPPKLFEAQLCRSGVKSGTPTYGDTML